MSKQFSRSDMLVATLAEFDKQRANLEALMPKGVGFDEFRSVANHALRSTPAILDCTPDSIFTAFTKAAYDGNNPDGHMAVIIPRRIRVSKNPDRYELQAVYMPMIAGVRAGIIRDGGGLVHDVQATIVYRNEPFRIIGGLSPSIEHEICPEGDARGPAIGVYAWARYSNGGPPTFVYLTKHEIAQIQAKADDKSKVWGDFWDQMWIKSAIRRLRKTLPLTGPVRDAEASTMFPQFSSMAGSLEGTTVAVTHGGAKSSLTAPPPRPTREDFATREQNKPESRERETARSQGRGSTSKVKEFQSETELTTSALNSVMNLEEIRQILEASSSEGDLVEKWKLCLPSINQLSPEEQDDVRTIYTDCAADHAGNADGREPDPANAAHQSGE